MDQNQNELHTGYNDLMQVEVSIESAQKMVGSATMSLDPEALNNAGRAIANARTMLNEANQHSTGMDTEFLQKAEQSLAQCEHQLSEAKKH
ncbi:MULTISPECIES: DUF2564 family protein [Bacillus]|uniref:DUF2564 family protein n=1 Tax=Bacillus TaxID=1386 RepID=UPI000BB7FBEE|nr:MULTISPECIES: DUF2564 family protein [Bacillus]